MWFLPVLQYMITSSIVSKNKLEVHYCALFVFVSHFVEFFRKYNGTPMQGAKKVGFTACHSAQYVLAQESFK